ncbi:MAG TPA: hypothetical protein P5076_15305, partial [Myxococcota bacterium]|nr:hypothetical protein [Myxococcota bacterium]
GQPLMRMQEWSPVQVSLSTPKRSRTTRSPRATAARCSGFWRAYLERFGAAELVPRLAPT